MMQIEQIRIVQDFAEQDRQDALWRLQHPKLVVAVRATVIGGVCLIWFAAFRVGYFLWCLYRATR